MRSKGLAGSLIASLALVAVLASSASATLTTERSELYVKESTEQTLAGARAADAEIVAHTKGEPELGKKFTLKFSAFGKPVDATATGVQCIACLAENKEVTSKAGASAVVTGKLKFTGVTVDEPANCVLASETGEKGVILTKSLTLHMDQMHEGKEFVSFIPAAGTSLMQLKLLNEGGCTVFGSFNFVGSISGEVKNKTGTFAKAQEIEVGPAIQTTTGAELLSEVKADLTGTLALSLTKTVGGEKLEFAVKP